MTPFCIVSLMLFAWPIQVFVCEKVPTNIRKII